VAKIIKWIAGAAIGWFMLGPLGAVIGIAVAELLDSNSIGGNKTSSQYQQNHNGFAVSLVVLIAAVLKTNGRVMQSELNYVKQFFVRQFGIEAAKESMILLRDVLKKDIPLYEVCMQIRQNLNIASRRELLHLLFGVAAADGTISAQELKTIEQIAQYIGISEMDFRSVKAMFMKDGDADWAYKILEIKRSASNDEVKKAYRKMAQKNHPDKVAQMGEDIQRAAAQKFNAIKDAYDHIKKERGIS
jgi:DnaJ like chaperone protein